MKTKAEVLVQDLLDCREYDQEEKLFTIRDWMRRQFGIEDCEALSQELEDEWNFRVMQRANAKGDEPKQVSVTIADGGNRDIVCTLDRFEGSGVYHLTLESWEEPTSFGFSTPQGVHPLKMKIRVQDVTVDLTQAIMQGIRRELELETPLVTKALKKIRENSPAGNTPQTNSATMPDISHILNRLSALEDFIAKGNNKLGN